MGTVVNMKAYRGKLDNVFSLDYNDNKNRFLCKRGMLIHKDEERNKWIYTLICENNNLKAFHKGLFELQCLLLRNEEDMKKVIDNDLVFDFYDDKVDGNPYYIVNGNKPKKEKFSYKISDPLRTGKVNKGLLIAFSKASNNNRLKLISCGLGNEIKDYIEAIIGAIYMLDNNNYNNYNN